MSKLPIFVNEQEEAEFWDTHDSTEFLDETEPVETQFVDQRTTKKQITIRLEPATIEQLKRVARTKGIGYQTLIRLWVTEQLQKTPV
ncbi:MAG TPA: CopG family antitoxin [Caldilineaceae bacterium]|nr:CopG family antitoxin [Caldilineaceae bacterium]